MIDQGDWVNVLLSVSIWNIAKVFVSLALILYVLFALIVVRQIFLMTGTLNSQLELPLKAVGLIHFFGAILILFFAIATL